MVVATSPPTEFGATVAALARPVMAKPPPSHPAEEAAWAGMYRVSVAREKAATPRSAWGTRVQVLRSIKSRILSLVACLQWSAKGVPTAYGPRFAT
jgi:hypothetical protein